MGIRIMILSELLIRKFRAARNALRHFSSIETKLIFTVVVWQAIGRVIVGGYVSADGRPAISRLNIY